MELGGAADEGPVERVDAEAGRDARGELGDVERVLGGLRLLGAEDREDELAVALGDRRGAVALVGQPVLGEDERGDRVGLRLDEDGGAERAAQGQRAGRGVEGPQRGGAAAPQLLRRAVEDEREGVGAEGEGAAEGGEPAAEIRQEDVARGVAVLRVEAAEIVDVEDEQEQRLARAEGRDAVASARGGRPASRAARDGATQTGRAQVRARTGRTSSRKIGRAARSLPRWTGLGGRRLFATLAISRSSSPAENAPSNRAAMRPRRLITNVHGSDCRRQAATGPWTGLFALLSW